MLKPKRHGGGARALRVAVAAAVIVLSVGSMIPAAEAAETPTGTILVVAPHPDDDIITAAGIAAEASDVTVAYMTNGDWCETVTPAKGNAAYCGSADPAIGTTRQGEAVSAQGLLGQYENDLRFLGYPDADLSLIWDGLPLTTLRTETYASRGLGSTDWHEHRTEPGEHGQYNKTDLLADLVALILDVRPDHVFTTSEFDRHPDHHTTYTAVRKAIELAIEADPTYQTTLHSTVVHVRNNSCWGWPHSYDPASELDPDCEGTTEVETWDVTCNWPGDSECSLVWDDREQFVVPEAMQNPVSSGSNLKYQALLEHDSQTGFEGGFILNWVHLDEIFWTEVLGNTPVAVDDGPYDAVEDGELVVDAPGVLDNDTDPNGDTLTAIQTSDASNGTADLNDDGSFTYTPDPGFSGPDSFTYYAEDPGGLTSEEATVTINVEAVNDPPVAVDDGPYVVVFGGSVSEPAPGVLVNDTDAEGDVLTAVKKTDPAHGTVTLKTDGSFTYTHDGSEATTDSFTYQAKDTADAMSNIATVSFTIGDKPPPVVDGHTTGLVDPLSGKWYLYDNDGVLTTSFFYGNPGDYPFMGDWDGDGVETPGLYRQSDGYVYLRNSNTVGVADVKFFFGNPGDVPIAGDFNADGFDTVSIYRPSNQTFYIINELGSGDEGLGAADFSYVFGDPGDKPFVGDFNANGEETVGLHRETTGLVYYRNTHTTGNADNQFLFGDPGDRLIAGDWNDNATFTPALYRPSDTTMYFRYTNSQGNADNQYIPTPTNPTWLPVSGKTK
ncbi:MAG: Ig-like domain-containing protein [Actinomycetota bacterium]|nr:Ig-like domain-containing protein [Actinomycetota bacterium]